MGSNSDVILRELHYVTSEFGKRIDPITGVSKLHNGTDYGTNQKNIPCYPYDSGDVIKTGSDSVSGNYVKIKHSINGKNYIAIYCHLLSVFVKTDQIVLKDSQIGLVGKTGQCTGIHLHFGWFDESAGRYIDFEKWSGNYSEENNQSTLGYEGTSLVDCLKSIGQDSSFENRSTLALQNNIVLTKNDYRGTLEQNLDLLKKIRENYTD